MTDIIPPNISLSSELFALAVQVRKNIDTARISCELLLIPRVGADTAKRRDLLVVVRVGAEGFVVAKVLAFVAVDVVVAADFAALAAALFLVTSAEYRVRTSCSWLGV